MSNSRNVSSVFDRIKAWASGPFLIWVFLISLVTAVIGAIHFVEDTYSSYEGLQFLSETYNLRLVKWPFVWWSMSLAPQVGQVAFGYAWASDRKRNGWALYVFATLFVVDFIADLYFRRYGIIGGDMGTLVGALITFGYFTVGSEIFLTMGLGLSLSTFPNAVAQIKILRAKYAHAMSGLGTGDDYEVPAHSPSYDDMSSFAGIPDHAPMRER